MGEAKIPPDYDCKMTGMREKLRSFFFSHPDFDRWCRNLTCSAVLKYRSWTIPPVRNFTVSRILLFYSTNQGKTKILPRKCIAIKTYASISITTPEPTVLPPSRIAKRRPFSIAIGVMSSTLMSTLSPGRHISVPSGRVIVPVTSVVLK